MQIFETVSFHIVKPCNMRCKFCYATFEDINVGAQMGADTAFLILKKLKDAGVQKITFAGGEPLLYKHIKDVIIFSKELGMTTSIISNGSLINEKFLSEMRTYLDWIGLSIDSLDPLTNFKIGRVTKMKMDYEELISRINSLGYNLKINTVVNKFNADEDFTNLLAFSKASRWKVFQTLKVEGQNDKQFEDIKCTNEQFQNFISAHKHIKVLVPEDNEAMTGSYLLIDPKGRIFENSKGEHTYSDSLAFVDINTALSQVNLDRNMFIKRGGIYDWK